MRIYHLGALFFFCIGLGIIIGYSIEKIEVLGVAGLILGVIPIIIYRKSFIRKEKISISGCSKVTNGFGGAGNRSPK